MISLKPTPGTVIQFGSNLKAKFSPTDTSYNSEWQWLGHPPMTTDCRGEIGECYGRAWGPLKNGKKHGITYLAHYCFYKGQCWHRRTTDCLMWTDGITTHDNNWVCCANYVDGKLAALPKEYNAHGNLMTQYRIHLDAPNEENGRIEFRTPVAFNTAPPDPDISIPAKWHAGGSGIPAITDIVEKFVIF